MRPPGIEADLGWKNKVEGKIALSEKEEKEREEVGDSRVELILPPI